MVRAAECSIAAAARRSERDSILQKNPTPKSRSGVGFWDLPARFLPPAASAPATAATTSAAAASAEPAPAATRLLRACFVDRQRPTTKALLMELSDGVLRILISGHFHEREPTSATGFAIAHDVHSRNIPSLGKQRGEVVLIRIVREIADVEFVTHSALCASSRCSLETRRSERNAQASLAQEGREGGFSYRF
jgi:hypothetical protein